jgi:hypothetical protein
LERDKKTVINPTQRILFASRPLPASRIAETPVINSGLRPLKEYQVSAFRPDVNPALFEKTINELDIRRNVTLSLCKSATELYV